MPEPDVLYHYTSQAGLLGIVASDSIWATDIYALNDWTEFQHVFKTASVQVLVHAFKSGLPDDIDANAKQMVIERVLAERNFPVLLDIIKAERPPYGERKGVFVCSFTASGDLLSQWRGYSYSSQGFSLGFDSTLLKKQSQSVHTLDTPIELVECVYDEATTLERIRAMGHTAAEGFRDLRQRDEVVPPSFCTQLNPTENYRKDAYYLSKSFTFASVPFFRAAAQFKHPGFQEEREWRIVYSAFWKKLSPHSVKFRNGQFGPTAYVEIPLGLHTPATCSLRRIVVGPRTYGGQEMDAIINSVEMLLLKYGIPVRSPATPSGVEMVTSQIPYRSA
jgi:DUF2971 family protein